MARESFEDEEIAAILNESFLPVKIDREEHPEIDAVYLLACEILRGHAGWPLTILALPDGWPFFVATYLPKEGDGYRLGLKELLLAVRKAWESNRAQILESAREIRQALEAVSFVNPGTFDRKEVLKRAFEELWAQFDPQYGGFGRAAKFPLPLRLLYLLHFGEDGPPEVHEMVKKTLFKMRFSGLFDQVGFGFHRYTIDRAWRVPHFEKMLYDQGLLLYLYAEAAKHLSEPLYERVAREIVTYLQENLEDPRSGLFYSAESAESEGEEGLFYTWSFGELEEFLEAEELKILKSYFDLHPEGNYLEEGCGRPSGRNILFPLHSGEGERPSGPPVEPLLQKLKAFREKKPRPPRDEKFLTDWNALAIAGLAHAGKILREKDFILLAKNAFEALWQKSFSQGRLLHVPECLGLKGLLEDYVFLAWAALELFEATSDSSYFEKMAFLLEETEKLFKTSAGLYQQVGNDKKPFLIKFFPVFEGAIPSGNGLLAYLLAKIGRFSASQKILTGSGKYLQERPGDFPSFLLALLQ